MTPLRLLLLLAVIASCSEATAQSDALAEYARTARLKKAKPGTVQIRMVPLEIGSAAPDIAAAEWLNTRPVRLQQLRGRVILLDFWAVWCAPCVAALPELARLSKANADRLSVVTVHYATPAERVQRYLRQHDIRHPVAIDDGETWKRFSIRHLPTYVLIDREGRVQWVGETLPRQADLDRLMPSR